jgi:hypothetical protein
MFGSAEGPLADAACATVKVMAACASASDIARTNRMYFSPVETPSACTPPPYRGSAAAKTLM